MEIAFFAFIVLSESSGIYRQTGRLLWQLGPFNAMDINPPFHSTTMSIKPVSHRTNGLYGWPPV